MTSILHTIAAKSDQLNAEDLIGGQKTVRVTGVRVSASNEQPVAISYEGDQGKPFKPCLTMRRLLVRVWGDDSTHYTGRSMTLYLDPEVKYGGMKVGGIRISEMSHMDAPQSFYLTETRGKKKQHTVNPIKSQQPATSNDPNQNEIEAVKAAGFDAASKGRDAFVAWWNSEAVKANQGRVRKIVNGLFPNTEVLLEAMQTTAVEADAKVSGDLDGAVDDPFSAKIPA